MATYQDIRHQVKTLTPDEQLRLLEELNAMVNFPKLTKSKSRIMDLEGLGKEIWQGFDAQEYIDRERDSWNG